MGTLLDNMRDNIESIKSKENIILIQDKIRSEMKNSIKKDQILNQEDAILLKKFLEKINSEIKNAN